MTHHPPLVVTRLDGTPVAEGTPIADLALPGEMQELEIWTGDDDA